MPSATCSFVMMVCWPLPFGIRLVRQRQQRRWGAPIKNEDSTFVQNITGTTIKHLTKTTSGGPAAAIRAETNGQKEMHGLARQFVTTPRTRAIKLGSVPSLTGFSGHNNGSRREEDTTMERTSFSAARCYHASPKKEILPLVVAGLVVGGGYYGYRAMQRMNTEWEDYQWELQRYEKQQLKENQPVLQTIGIDLGSVYSKITVTHPTLEVVANREGDHSFFNGLVYDSEDASSVVSSGRSALEKFSYHSDSVTMPYTALSNNQKVVTDSLKPVIDEVLDRFNEDHPVRKVVALPAAFLYDTTYQAAFKDLVQEATSHAFVPEAVAAVWGAQFENRISDDPKQNILVVDVGGFVTQLSVVATNKVLYSTTLPFGGETFVEELVQMVQKPEFEDDRSLSMLQIHARGAVAALSSETRAQIHVPYISMNTHLDESVARVVLEQKFESHIRTLSDLPNLSKSLPPPTDMNSFWMSAITNVLEQTSLLPNDLEKVLLVGGGAKVPFVQSSVSSALNTFMGPNDKYTYVETEVTALGAATLLPSFDYDVEKGLIRH